MVQRYDLYFKLQKIMRFLYFKLQKHNIQPLPPINSVQSTKQYFAKHLIIIIIYCIFLTLDKNGRRKRHHMKQRAH